MARFAMALVALALLAGCNDEITVEDNSPDERERRNAMRMCLGVHLYKIDDAPYEQRLACVQAIAERVQAIYGGTQ